MTQAAVGGARRLFNDAFWEFPVSNATNPAKPAGVTETRIIA